MHKKLLALGSSLALGLGVAMFQAAPASASAWYITVCNSNSSVDAIEVYNTSEGYSTILYSGQGYDDCDNNVPDFGNGARVDVDIAGGLADVDSWKKKKNSGAYGPCYDNEDQSSDPYSDSTGTATTYRTYSHTGC